jgi:hypothetical protein
MDATTRAAYETVLADARQRRAEAQAAYRKAIVDADLALPGTRRAANRARSAALNRFTSASNLVLLAQRALETTELDNSPTT